MTWKPEDVSFEFDDDGTADPVVTVRIETPVGPIFAMAEVEERGRALILNGFHMHSDAGVRQIGISNLRMLAQHVLGARPESSRDGHLLQDSRLRRPLRG
jgi:hypothetical protein